MKDFAIHEINVTTFSSNRPLEGFKLILGKASYTPKINYSPNNSEFFWNLQYHYKPYLENVLKTIDTQMCCFGVSNLLQLSDPKIIYE